MVKWQFKAVSSFFVAVSWLLVACFPWNGFFVFCAWGLGHRLTVVQASGVFAGRRMALPPAWCSARPNCGLWRNFVVPYGNVNTVWHM